MKMILPTLLAALALGSAAFAGVRTWTNQDGQTIDARAGEGVYIAIGNGLHRMSSNDGRTWTNHRFKEKPGHGPADLKDIAVGNGAWAAVGGFSRSNILSTTDGVEWHINDFNIGLLRGVIFTVIFAEGFPSL